MVTLSETDRFQSRYRTVATASVEQEANIGGQVLRVEQLARALQSIARCVPDARLARRSVKAVATRSFRVQHRLGRIVRARISIYWPANRKCYTLAFH